jgi:hypothetical protein
MVMNHSSCHDPPSLHPLLPGGVGYHCSAEPKGGNDVSATFACMDTWQPFVGWLPWGELTLRRMAHWGRWFAHENWCFSASMLGYRRIYVGMFCPKYPKHATGTGLPRCGQGPLPSAGFLFQCPKSQDAAGQDTVMKSTHPKGFCA